APSPWIFLAGMFVFTLGEMTAHPKFISYVGLIAPPDKKALYQGYSFLYGVIGSGVGGILGAWLYVLFVEKLNQPSMLWITFSMIGVLTIIGLLLYNRFLAPKN
ncbi:MFS transporter, partial [Bacteroidota bacterium]